MTISNSSLCMIMMVYNSLLVMRINSRMVIINNKNSLMMFRNKNCLMVMKLTHKIKTNKLVINNKDYNHQDANVSRKTHKINYNNNQVVKTHPILMISLTIKTFLTNYLLKEENFKTFWLKSIQELDTIVMSFWLNKHLYQLKSHMLVKMLYLYVVMWLSWILISWLVNNYK